MIFQISTFLSADVSSPDIFAVVTRFLFLFHTHEKKILLKLAFFLLVSVCFVSFYYSFFFPTLVCAFSTRILSSDIWILAPLLLIHFLNLFLCLSLFSIAVSAWLQFSALRLVHLSFKCKRAALKRNKKREGKKKETNEHIMKNKQTNKTISLVLVT